MSESLVVRKWVPHPSEIFIDTLPFGKAPASTKDGQYLLSVSFTIVEIMKLPRKKQVEVFLKVFETMDTLARIQKVPLKEVFGVRYNSNKGKEMMCFFAYYPKKVKFA